MLMKFHRLSTAFLGLALINALPAQEPAVATPISAATEAAAPAPEEEKEQEEAPATSTSKKDLTEQEILASENKLEAERLTHTTNSMRAEIARLKLERELMTEKAAYDVAKRRAARQEEFDRLEAEKLKITQTSELAKLRADKLSSELKIIQTEAALEITRLQNDITRIETAERRARFADSKPVFLKQPLKENGIVVISDRRIPLNGLITPVTADYVTSRIQYWNNKDRELPIFIVIDASPGGSVMAGYRILKAMESSDAPIHVVVKSFAGSMAAAITTLAEESYAYPNAVILHHQISSTIMRQLNLTEQREFHEESQRWWVRLGTPIADKMGITTDELIKRMYARSSSGDWSEFAEQAKDLKWVNHIVQGIDETSVTKDPDAPESTARAAQPGALGEEVDANGEPFAWLPRLTPKDVYFLYNPDKYYRMR